MFNNDQETLETIQKMLDFDTSSASAVMYGISINDDGNPQFVKFAEDGDVYDLIENIRQDQIHRNYNYITLKTTGWAAPINADGSVNGAPSEHPERRRVRLFVTLDINNEKVIGSSLTFNDDSENPIYDFNTAEGSLADAMESLVR